MTIARNVCSSRQTLISPFFFTLPAVRLAGAVMPRAGERGERRVNMRVGASGVSAGRGRASSAFRPEWQTNITIFITTFIFIIITYQRINISSNHIIYDDENEFSFYFSQEIKKLFLLIVSTKIQNSNSKLYIISRSTVQYRYIL